MFDWAVLKDAPMQESLAQQKEYVRAEFERRMQQSVLALNEQGLNVALYWANPDPRKYVNIVPTSAITGEGAPSFWSDLARTHASQQSLRPRKMSCNRRRSNSAVTCDLCSIGTSHVRMEPSCNCYRHEPPQPVCSAQASRTCCSCWWS